MPLSDDKETHIIDAFNTTSRYLADILNNNTTYLYYIPMNDTTLELSVFWPSDTESWINKLRFSESIPLSFKMRLTLATCFCGDVM